ncbi:ATP-binding cassette domain-containing protein [bacterium]|nr:ATP-binding cassette domain-containing protein [bacterium]
MKVNTTDTVLQTENLAIGYRHTGRADLVISRNLDLRLRRGELVCLLGPNGAGKSTLMRTLAGLQPALAGTILLDGDPPADLTAREMARRLSIVLTERVDVGNLSAQELVALGRHPYTDWWGNLTVHDEEVVRWAVRVVGAGALAERPIQELSDGERQKVMIARALAQEPLLILLDEPTAFLDLPRRVEVMGLLRNLARHTGRAILLSTHDLDLALRSADRLWLMAADGGMVTGAPEDLVLSGAFERAFASEGVTFDPYTGSFHIVRDTSGVVLLQADGMQALWATRALEREGYCVVRQTDDKTPTPVATVTADASADAVSGWQINIHGRTERVDDIYALIGVLRGEP